MENKQQQILENHDDQRTKCLVFTRVMGYHRPVESFNIGKKENIKNAYHSLKANVSKAIYHITPFTLLDYPDKTACIVWFAGCNMRCRYCYNIDIVKGKGNLEYDKAIAFINSRKTY